MATILSQGPTGDGYDVRVLEAGAAETFHFQQQPADVEAALTAGQVASLRIAATVGVAAEGIVWQDVSDTAIVSDAQAILSNVTYGNSALGTAIAAIPTTAAPTASANATAAATAILATPANKLATDTSGRVTTGTISDKTGYKLASDGLDSISTTAPAGVASNFREMLVQVWRRFFRQTTMTATQLKTYDDAGTGTLTTQTVSDDGTTQTQGAAT